MSLIIGIALSVQHLVLCSIVPTFIDSPIGDQEKFDYVNYKVFLYVNYEVFPISHKDILLDFILMLMNC